MRFLLIPFIALSFVACQSEQKIEGLEIFKAAASGNHKTGSLKYTSNPPVPRITDTGETLDDAHNGVWQNCGVYDQQIQLEVTVHSLEHGAVWIAYQPNLGEADVKALRALVKGKPYVILAPYFYGGLDKPVVAVAWGARLKLDKADDPRLAQFVAQFANGPKSIAPEKGAQCVSGTGIPLANP